jgi:Nucleotidyltransferase domain
VCIYATGSYGRGESSDTSDIDLFIVDAAQKDEPRLRRIPQITLKADLIRICERLGLPPFSGDGRFLEVHRLDDMTSKLGGPHDDAENLFTARMLLMLESKHLSNEPVYEEVIEDIVAAYFLDYAEHEADFLPIFLANDIIRFWKPLCLNYEFHRRDRRTRGQTEGEDRLQNLKLRFSRTITCYSAVAFLCWEERRTGRVEPSAVVNIAHRTPTERVEFLGEQGGELAEPATRVIEHYTWFLTQFASRKEECVAWLKEAGNSAVAWKRADEYRRAFFELLNAAGRDGGTCQRE